MAGSSSNAKTLYSPAERITIRSVPIPKYLFLFLISLSLSVGAQDRIPIIFDTDFVMPPQDDALALMLAQQSPKLEILGITTEAGNDSVERATSDVLRMLEIGN